MIEKLDARAEQWPTPMRWLYLSFKWSLVVLGAACLLYAWALRMGWKAALWFAFFPAVYGVMDALRSRHGQSDSPPPDRELP
jgi:Trk-type K+ transport system membrane component